MWTDKLILHNGHSIAELPVIPSSVNTIAVDVETRTDLKYGHVKQYGLSYLADVTVFTCTYRTEQGYQTYTFNAPFNNDELLFIGDCLSIETVIAHNAVFDMRQLNRVCDDFPKQVYCTQSIERILHPVLHAKYSLIDLANYYKIEYPQFLLEQKKKRSKQHKETLETVLHYASWDSYLAYLIYENQQRAIENEKAEYKNLTELIEWEIKAVTEYCIIARRGVGINMKYAQKRIDELTTLRDSVMPDLPLSVQTKTTKKHGTVELPFNPGSPKQREILIYDKLGIPKPKFEMYSVYYTKHFGLSTSTDAIKAYLTFDYRILEDTFPDKEQLNYVVKTLKALHQWVACETQLKVIKALVDHASVDGKVHTMLSVATTTSRRNSTHPQMQNIKMAGSPDDIEGNLTGLFNCLDPMFTLIENDLNNAENRYGAVIAGDNVLAQACMSQDFHAYNAGLYFPEFKNLEKGSAEWSFWRDNGKKVTFGSEYGMGMKRLAHTLDITEDEARQILNNKRAAFRQVWIMKQAARQVVQSRGYITLWTGRRIPVDRKKDYTSWNYIIQGGIAELVKRSIIVINAKYRESGMKSYVAHDMHDAIILAVHRDEWDNACNIASEVMENMIPAELNQRTNPVMRWKARPDFVKNAKKWGKKQYIPKEYRKKLNKPEIRVVERADNATLIEGTITVECFSLPVWTEKESGGYTFGEHKKFIREAAREVVKVWKQIATVQGMSDKELERGLGYSLKELSEI